MSKEAAVKAYKDSLSDSAKYDIERRIDSRMTPIIGGMWPSVKKVGNTMFRPIKVGKALIAGYDGNPAQDFPKMPDVPAVFTGSSLGNAFAESWKLKEEAAKARAEGFASMLNADFPGWLQKSSIASYAEAKDNRVIFPEDGIAHDAFSYGAGNSSLPISSRDTSRTM